MTHDDIAALRQALAAGPTPGPWLTQTYETIPGSSSAIVRPASSSVAICGQKSNRTNGRSAQRLADLAYIAAASPDRIARLLDALEAAQRVPLSRGLTPADRFEDAIREVGVVFACEWFGHAKYSDFTQETIRVLSERAAMKDQA